MKEVKGFERQGALSGQRRYSDGPWPEEARTKGSHPSIPEATEVFPALTQDGFLSFACLLSFDSAVQREWEVLMFWIQNVLSG